MKDPECVVVLFPSWQKARLVAIRPMAGHNLPKPSLDCHGPGRFEAWLHDHFRHQLQDLTSIRKLVEKPKSQSFSEIRVVAGWLHGVATCSIAVQWTWSARSETVKWGDHREGRLTELAFCRRRMKHPIHDCAERTANIIDQGRPCGRPDESPRAQSTDAVVHSPSGHSSL